MNIKGKRVNEKEEIIEVANPLEHYLECGYCHKLIDKRDLGEVLSHSFGECI